MTFADGFWFYFGAWAASLLIAVVCAGLFAAVVFAIVLIGKK